MNKTFTLHLLCLFLLIFAGGGTLTAQVTADGNGVGVLESASASVTTLSSFTVPEGNNALLVVFAATGSSRTVTGITYQGNPLTKLGASSIVTTNSDEIWYRALGNVVAGGISGDIVVSINANSGARGVIAASYKNVDQTTPMNNFNSVTTPVAASSYSITITSANNDMVVSCIADLVGFGPTFSIAGGETLEANLTDGNRDFAASRELSSGSSVSMDWSGPIGEKPLIGGNIKEATALPVELLSFHAEKLDKEVSLKWQTASELNNDGFEIQKAEANAALAAGRWQVLAFVEGNGTTNEVQNYSFTDERPQAGLNYYRLKQIDFDGKFEYSDVVSVKLAVGSRQLSIFPNPIQSDELTLYLPESNDSKSIIRFYDQTGRLALQKTTFSEKGTLNVSQLTAGIYFVEVTLDGKVFREKVVVE